MAAGEQATVGGRYVLDQLIAHGGMADVYRGTDRLLDRTVAVKLLRITTDDRSDRARFASEARTLARLSHPSLVTLLDAGIEVDEPYLVMELIIGPTLTEMLRRPLPLPRVCELGAQLAEALAYAHAAGVVHRDVKPGNILIGEDGRARLTDFGIARLVDSAARHTQSGTTIGTAAYLSPEQVRAEPVTAAADVYALALVLIEALTGSQVYPGQPTQSALARLQRPPAVPDSVPANLRQLLASMTALDAAQRPSAEQVARSLAHLIPSPQEPTKTPLTPGGTRVLPAMDAGRPEPATSSRTLTASTATTTVLGNPALAPVASRLVAGWSAILSRCRATLADLSTTDRNWRLMFLTTLAGMVLVVFALAAVSGGDGGAGDDHRVPKGVPDRFQQPLQDLHDAVYGDSP